MEILGNNASKDIALSQPRIKHQSVPAIIRESYRVWEKNPNQVMGKYGGKKDMVLTYMCGRVSYLHVHDSWHI